MNTAHAPLSVAPLVAQACADEFGVSVADLIGRRRYEPLATARGIAMFILMDRCGFTGRNAGGHFGRVTWTASHYTRKICWEMANGHEGTIDRVQSVWERYQAAVKGKDA